MGTKDSRKAREIKEIEGSSGIILFVLPAGE